MLKKLIQRLSDPVFYWRRWALLKHRLAPGNPEVEEIDLDQIDPVRALVVVAHPDDEVFCSGLICELRRRRTKIHLLCLTRGEGGPLPAGTTRDELGEIRTREMRRSCDILGIDELTFLGHVDPLGTEYKIFPPEVSPSTLASQIRSHIDSDQPEIILTHGSWGEYWHPAHLLVHRAVLRAVEGVDGAILLTFKAGQPDLSMPKIVNHADVPHLKCDFSEHTQTRLEALEAHETQLETFAHFANESSHIEFIRQTARENYSIRKRPVSAR